MSTAPLSSTSATTTWTRTTGSPTRWVTVTQNLTKVWGTHTSKLGFFWERIVNTQPGSGWNHGLIGLAPWLLGVTGNSFADLLLGHTSYYQEQTSNVLHDVGWNRGELYGQDSWKLSPRLTLNYGARVSLFEPPTDLRGNGLSVWDESRHESDVAAGVEFPGVAWNARDPDVPVAGVGSSWAVQPRVGLAWDVRGNGETVLRGGVGLYLWRDPTGWPGGLIDLGAGVRLWEGFGWNLRDLEGLGGGNLAFGGTALDIGDDTLPRMWSWSLSLNQKLPWALNLEAGYVGNQSDRLDNGTPDRNAVPLGAMVDDPWGNPQAYRPFPAYGFLGVYRHSMLSSYHGLQALLARQRGSFNFTLAYTFSKALGTRTDSGSEYILTPLREYGYGPPWSDRTHVATGSFSWLLPEPASDGALRHVLGGWQLSGILSYVSGIPLPYGAGVGSNFNIQGTSADGYDLSQSQHFSGSPDVPTQPILTCDPCENVPDGHVFNPACFAAPTRGQNGNYNVPYIQGQPYWNVDFSVFKNFTLGGDKKLQLRFSACNALNHPIAFPDPARNLACASTAASWPTPASAGFPPRTIPPVATPTKPATASCSSPSASRSEPHRQRGLHRGVPPPNADDVGGVAPDDLVLTETITGSPRNPPEARRSTRARPVRLWRLPVEGVEVTRGAVAHDERRAVRGEAHPGNGDPGEKRDVARVGHGLEPRGGAGPAHDLSGCRDEARERLAVARPVCVAHLHLPETLPRTTVSERGPVRQNGLALRRLPHAP